MPAEIAASRRKSPQLGGDFRRQTKCVTCTVNHLKTKFINSQIFNGAKFRLHGFVPDGNVEGRTVLKMGLTSYKEMVGTHYAPDREELIFSAREKGLGN